MNPSKVQARKMVLAGVLVLALVTVYKDRRTSTPQGTYRTFWGVGVVAMFLALLADFLPQIAGPFALLIALGSLTHGGTDAIEKVLGVISPPPGSGSGAASPGTRPRPAPAGTPAVPAPAPSAHPVQ